MIYFDNAATTFPKPPEVTEEVIKCLKEYCGNPGRSAHRLSVMAAEKIYETRERLAQHLGLDNPECICFTSGATHALNIAIKCSIRKKCHVIISDCEHNSVLRPLHQVYKRYGVEISTFDSDKEPRISIPPLIKKNTRFIISTAASNVTGKRINLSDLSDIAKVNNLSLIIDASQAIGHTEISFKDTPMSILCAPGHKGLFGIQGIGFMAVGEDIIKDTLIEGGSGSDTNNREMPSLMPERYEAGTVSTPGIVSILAGLDFIERIGTREIKRKLNFLTENALDILSSFNNVKVYGAENGIISFNINDKSSYDIADQLNDKGICTRGGLHCAPTIHQKLGTAARGAVRISFSYLNSKKQLDTLYSSLKEIISI